MAQAPLPTSYRHSSANSKLKHKFVLTLKALGAGRKHGSYRRHVCFSRSRTQLLGRRLENK